MDSSPRLPDEQLGRRRKEGRIALGLHHERPTGLVAVVEEGLYADRLERAADVLRLAVASRSGNTNDAHIRAPAWALDADIWSQDRDFAGTGWPSWSNANLRASLRPPP